MTSCRIIAATLLALASQTSCGDSSSPTAPTRGSLAITVAGLPATVERHLVVTGPTRSFEVTTRDTVLRDLDPGQYTIESPMVFVSTGRWVADAGERTVTVPASATPTRVTVSYELWDSRLTLNITGLPSSAAASVELTGPLFSAMAVQSQTYGDLKAASYTIVAHDVAFDGITYRGAPATQTITLLPGTTPTMVSVSYAAITGKLTIDPGTTPAGVLDLITVTGPNGYTASVAAATVLTGLAPGTYTLTARNVTVEGTTYIPSPATQQVTVVAGVSATATFIYRGQLDLQLVTSLLGAVYLTAPAGDARLFIVQRAGQVRVVKDGQLLATPFLDLSARVTTDGERGLLSIAFDPLYATNGFVYVYFTDLLGDINVERFASTPGADVADPTPTPILSVPHRQYNNHNGGLVMFGPDGMLYAATGDGGSGGDPLGNGQNSASQLGKMLRIDVRQTPAAVQMWAKGLRNPWRFDFQVFPTIPTLGDLYIADVGQNRFEEINVAFSDQASLNYGWNLREGRHCYPSGELCPGTPGFRDPVFEYEHPEGCSVTGGFVYRGSAIAGLHDKYTFSDFCAGWLRTLHLTSRGYVQQHWSVPGIGNVVSFGEDAAGEQYMISGSGNVWKIILK